MRALLGLLFHWMKKAHSCSNSSFLSNFLTSYVLCYAVLQHSREFVLHPEGPVYCDKVHADCVAQCMSCRIVSNLCVCVRLRSTLVLHTRDWKAWRKEQSGSPITRVNRPDKELTLSPRYQKQGEKGQVQSQKGLDWNL